MVAGAHACALQGHIRATVDFDILVRNTEENLTRTIVALTQLFPDLPEPIRPEDITDNVVLKIADDIEVDVSISAWSVTYDEALSDRQVADVDGTTIPYLGLQSLIKSKSSPREIDQWDVRILRELERQRQG